MARRKPGDRTGAAPTPPLPFLEPFPAAAFYGGLAAALALSLAFGLSHWDLDLARLAYSPAPPHWPLRGAAPWSWLYAYGQAPAMLTGLAGLAAFGASFASPGLRRWRGPGLYLFLVLLLGPGLIVNVLGKGLAGRPRPSDLLDFGGTWEFRRAFEFGVPGRGKSFLSGHASMAFYFFCLGYLVQGARRLLLFACVAAFGLAMGLARMLQGGHFFSDVAICGALIFSLAAGLSPLIHWQPSRAWFGSPGLKPALALGALGWLLLANPIYEERRLRFSPAAAPAAESAPIDRRIDWQGQGEPSEINLSLESPLAELRLDFDAESLALQGLPLLVHERYQGSALPGAKESLDCAPIEPSASWPMPATAFGISLKQRPPTLAWDEKSLISMHFPSQKACEARLKSGKGGITIGTLPKGAMVLAYGHFSPDALPLGFEPYGMKAFLRPGKGRLIVLRLDAPSIRFEP